MARTPVENALFLGTSVGTGFLMETVRRRVVPPAQQQTAPILIGLAGAAAGIGISMFVRGRNAEAIGDGLAGGSLGWTGGRLENILLPNSVGAQAVSPLVAPRTTGANGRSIRVSSTRTSNNNSRTTSNSSKNNGSNVIEL